LNVNIWCVQHNRGQLSMHGSWETSAAWYTTIYMYI